MCKIVTHYHIDLDATFSVLLQVIQGKGSLSDVRYLPAGTSRLPANLRDAIVVDHDLGTKGSGSALADLPGAREVFGDMLVNEIDEQDRTGKAIPRIPLGRLFGAVRQELRDRGLKGAALDNAVLEYWDVAAKGLAKQEANRKRAVAEAHRVPIRQVGPYRFAVPFEPMAPGTSGVLADEHNVQGVIYQAPYGIGIHRFAGQNEPDLNKLVPHLQGTKEVLNDATNQFEEVGWFVHEAGYLACWGSRKAARHTKPPAGTPQNQKELLELLRTVFDDCKSSKRRGKGFLKPSLA